MKSVVSRWVHKAGQRWQKMVNLEKKFSLENFDSVIWSINWKKTNSEIPLYNARTYIGKMKKTGENIYSDDMLIVYMTYYFKQVSKWIPIQLIVAPKLSEILNGEENMQWYYSGEEEKKHIKKLAKKYFSERYKDLEIITIESLNPELFTVLKEKWSEWLSSTNKPILDKEAYTSLDIAKYLYRIAKHNDGFLKKIYDLKTQEQKNIDKNKMWENEWDRYGLCEIAMRLNDFLKWTNTQWWVRRQKKYDDIIVEMVNEKIPVKYGEVFDELRIFCQEILKTKWDKNFYTIHFDTKKSEEIEEKYKEKDKNIKRITKKIASNLLYILLGAWTVWWISQYQENKKQKELLAYQQKIDTDFVSKQKIFFYGWNGHGYYEKHTDQEKIEYIDKLKDEIYENIVIRYDIKQDKEEIKKLIKLYIKDKEILWKFVNTDNYKSNVFEISDNFVKKFNDILVEDGINKVPYEQFKEYEQYFRDLITNPNMSDENKISLSGDQGTLVSTSEYIPSPFNGKTTYYSSFDVQCIKNGKKRQLEDQKLFQVEDENDYRIKNYIGSSVDIQGHYIKDGYLYVKRWKDTKYNYIKVSTHDYEEEKKIDPSIIAYDYFYQSRKVISQIYSKFGNMYWGAVGLHDREKNHTYRWTKDTIKMLIIADLLKTGLLDKINPENNKEIINYLQWFVKRNSITIKKEWITTIPYDMHIRQYKEAFENTNTASSGHMREVISYNERDDYKFTYIGKYYTKEGIEYSIAQVTIDGKKYLFARNVQEDIDAYISYEWGKVEIINYYLNRWREVVKDYYLQQQNK